jgi:hypothetical protein
MSDLDPELADQLRAAAAARVQEQIAAAADRREQQVTIRNAFAERRAAGVDRRNAARAARLRLIDGHQGSDAQNDQSNRSTRAGEPTTPPDAA